MSDVNLHISNEHDPLMCNNRKCLITFIKLIMNNIFYIHSKIAHWVVQQNYDIFAHS